MTLGQCRAIREVIAHYQTPAESHLGWVDITQSGKKVFWEVEGQSGVVGSAWTGPGCQFPHSTLGLMHSDLPCLISNKPDIRVLARPTRPGELSGATPHLPSLFWKVYRRDMAPAMSSLLTH